MPKRLRKSEKSDTQPQVYKEEELKLMIELIEAGLWRSTNLANALHINIDTVTEWKKRPEVQDAHRRTILKYAKRRKDEEKVLKELNVESDPEPANNQFAGLVIIRSDGNTIKRLAD